VIFVFEETLRRHLARNGGSLVKRRAPPSNLIEPLCTRDGPDRSMRWGWTLLLARIGRITDEALFARHIQEVYIISPSTQLFQNISICNLYISKYLFQHISLCLDYLGSVSRYLRDFATIILCSWKHADIFFFVGFIHARFERFSLMFNLIRLYLPSLELTS